MERRRPMPEFPASERQSGASSKRQKQSEHTRALLLHAAEKIFTRDGFEAAKLEEIAAEAGYTRGAFYANFASKEDLFLAMLEEKIHGRIRQVRAAVEQFDDPAERLSALRDHYVCGTHDRDWTILGLEFKLFALRHPEPRKKVAAMRRRIMATAAAVLDEQLQQSRIVLPISTRAFAIALGSLMHGLELDRMLDKSISEEEIKKVGRIFFESMVGRSR